MSNKKRKQKLENNYRRKVVKNKKRGFSGDNSQRYLNYHRGGSFK